MQRKLPLKNKSNTKHLQEKENKNVELQKIQKNPSFSCGKSHQENQQNNPNKTVSLYSNRVENIGSDNKIQNPPINLR